MLGIAGALFSAVTYALAIVLMRSRASKDGPEAIALLGAIVPGLIVAVPAFATGKAPPATDLPYFLALGALASAGIYLLARAYAHAEAQVLAPLEFTALIWASLIGFFFFAEVPRPQVGLGGAVIVAACLWGARKEKAKILTPYAPGSTPADAAE
ncbi:MAG: DMT family transporter [Parvularculaceae bacterium]